MTHLYDTEEPNVVNHELLRRCVLAQGPEGEAGRLAKEEGIEFSAVLHLRLDFQSEHSEVGGASCYSNLTHSSSADILRIENLSQFTALKKLQLDNNIIEKIDGLECLVNLEWLGESRPPPWQHQLQWPPLTPQTCPSTTYQRWAEVCRDWSS